MPEVKLDRRGRPYTQRIMSAELRRGKHPPNYGRTFPAEVYERGEVQAIFDALQPRRPGASFQAVALRDIAMFTVMYRAGGRIGETLKLDIGDVDFARGTIHIRQGKGRGGNSKRRGPKARVVGIDHQALQLVADWVTNRATREPSTGPLFTVIYGPSAGARVLHTVARAALARAAVRAGVTRRIVPHGLRHTCAIELLQEGLNVKQIQVLLGHNSLSATDTYLNHLHPQDLIDAMQGRSWDLQFPTRHKAIATDTVGPLLALLTGDDNASTAPAHLADVLDAAAAALRAQAA